MVGDGWGDSRRSSPNEREICLLPIRAKRSFLQRLAAGDSGDLDAFDDHLDADAVIQALALSMMSAEADKGMWKEALTAMADSDRTDGSLSLTTVSRGRAHRQLHDGCRPR